MLSSSVIVSCCSRGTRLPEAQAIASQTTRYTEIDIDIDMHEHELPPGQDRA